MEETANTYFHWITFCDLGDDAGTQECSTICSHLVFFFYNTDLCPISYKLRKCI